jgi:hypothetical protein
MKGKVASDERVGARRGDAAHVALVASHLHVACNFPENNLWVGVFAQSLSYNTKYVVRQKIGAILIFFRCVV